MENRMFCLEPYRVNWIAGAHEVCVLCSWRGAMGTVSRTAAEQERPGTERDQDRGERGFSREAEEEEEVEEEVYNFRDWRNGA